MDGQMTVKRTYVMPGACRELQAGFLDGREQPNAQKRWEAGWVSQEYRARFRTRNSRPGVPVTEKPDVVCYPSRSRGIDAQVLPKAERTARWQPLLGGDSYSDPPVWSRDTATAERVSLNSVNVTVSLDARTSWLLEEHCDDKNLLEHERLHDMGRSLRRSQVQFPKQSARDILSLSSISCHAIEFLAFEEIDAFHRIVRALDRTRVCAR
jgi:hypothetical protein